MSALALEGVGVELGGRSVLGRVDLTVEPGELVLLAGRNGAGKTTLLRAAAGLLPLARGEVSLDGRPLESFGRRALGPHRVCGVRRLPARRGQLRQPRARRPIQQGRRRRRGRRP
jgi:ABC-type cobalamin/Fe3+-siderophores transport system ATPase subunit